MRRGKGKRRSPLVAECFGEASGWLARVLRGRGVDLRVAEGLSALADTEDEEVQVRIASLSLAGESALDLLARAAEDGAWSPPCVVVLEPWEWAHADACLRAGAAEVVEAGDDEGLIAALASPLNLRASREPRAAIDAPVTVSLGALDLHARAVDIRPSGVALAGLPAQGRGLVAELGIPLGADSIRVHGRLVRSGKHGHESLAAFAFVSVPSATRAKIRDWVEAQRDPPEDTPSAAWAREIRAVVAEYYGSNALPPRLQVGTTRKALGAGAASEAPPPMT